MIVQLSNKPNKITKMETKKAVVEGEIFPEDSKAQFVYKVRLEDGVFVEALSKRKHNAGDNVRVSKISHVPAIFKIFEGAE